MKRALFALAAVLLASCSTAPSKREAEHPRPNYFKTDPATAASISGTVTFHGRKPAPVRVDMSEDPQCVEAHKTGQYDGPVVVDAAGDVGNAFIYVKSGLEGKFFEPPATPAVLDQHGCWFEPRILGIQTGQTLKVTNSDPVTHNIHPLAQVNREWNHSQGEGDAPLSRRFIKPEVMIRVKCNIHSWMRAYIGAVDHPYFAVSGRNGKYEIRNLPPGEYVVGVWHEVFGTEERRITVPPAGAVHADFGFKGE